MQTATINQRERDYEGYQAFEYERRRVDEITNATERIAVPMRNTFEYIYDEGDLWFQGQNIRTILETTIQINERVVETKPQFITELIRNHIELETRLIDDLLDATSISRGKLQMELVVTDVHALLAQTRELMGGEAALARHVAEGHLFRRAGAGQAGGAEHRQEPGGDEQIVEAAAGDVHVV